MAIALRSAGHSALALRTSNPHASCACACMWFACMHECHGRYTGVGPCSWVMHRESGQPLLGVHCALTMVSDPISVSAGGVDHSAS